jgi:cytochrome c oxidase subunit 2
VPANEPVVVALRSRDVIHSFFVPRFRLKQDILPGRETLAWFECTRPGEYDLVCAELCGWGHYKMAGKVRALPRAEFEAFLAERRARSPRTAWRTAGEPPRTRLLDDHKVIGCSSSGAAS